MVKNRVSAAVCVLTLAASCAAETLPAGLAGTWRITRLLPTKNVTCWTDDQASALVGTSLSYSQKTMHWKGGDVPLIGITTRMVSDEDLRAETGGDSPVNFSELEIKQPSVLEVDLQHEDADITGATTEVPGDSVLMAAPGRIVGSVCGVYFEAKREPAAAKRR